MDNTNNLIADNFKGDNVNTKETNALKVLAIGNSFSDDGMEYLYQIASDLGYTEIVLGNMVIPGCSLATHADNVRNNHKAYHYRKNTDGTWITHPFLSMEECLKDEHWDVVTMQQASGFSGVPETYNDDVDTILAHVLENSLNKNVKLFWHMTWAYDQTSTHGHFSNYNHDQLTMYNAILKVVQNKIVTNDAFSGIIPSGTSIQNLRTSFLSSRLTRDGFHLSFELGRYIAGITWFAALTGKSINSLSYVPNEDPLIEKCLPLIKKAVSAAIKNPFKITKCRYKTLI